MTTPIGIHSEIEAVVFDVIGTLVDEHGGLRAGIREAVPGADDARVEELLSSWQEHVEVEQRRMSQGQRDYASTEVLDLEAARRVADRAGLTDPATIADLATTAERLAPWKDSAAALERLAQHLPVIALSNASSTALLRLNAHAGLRWHQTLSSETVRAYKPASEVYQHALTTVGRPAPRVLMVAAHAWDLRGAQAEGMRTAYVHRPGGDPPTDADSFDWRFDSLDELVAMLTGSQAEAAPGRRTVARAATGRPGAG